MNNLSNTSTCLVPATPRSGALVSHRARVLMRTVTTLTALAPRLAAQGQCAKHRPETTHRQGCTAVVAVQQPTCKVNARQAGTRVRESSGAHPGVNDRTVSQELHPERSFRKKGKKKKGNKTGNRCQLPAAGKGITSSASAGSRRKQRRSEALNDFPVVRHRASAAPQPLTTVQTVSDRPGRKQGEYTCPVVASGQHACTRIHTNPDRCYQRVATVVMEDGRERPVAHGIRPCTASLTADDHKLSAQPARSQGDAVVCDTTSSCPLSLAVTASCPQAHDDSRVPYLADDSSQQIPAGRDQQPCPDRSLVIRSLRPPTSPAHSFPGKQEVLSVLPASMSDMDPMGLGMGLGLSVHLLLDDADWVDAFGKARGLLRLAHFPLSLEELSQALEEPPVCACEIAAQVRALARSRGVERLVDRRGPLCDAFARLLVPLAGEIETGELAAALGIQELWLEAMDMLLARSKGQRRNTAELAVDQAIAERDGQHQVPDRTHANWLEAFARSGASADTLQQIAWRWELAPPLGCVDWTHYLQLLCEQIGTQVLLEHEQHPDAPVPLQQAWFLVHGHSQQAAFPLALDDATDPAFLKPDDRPLSGLASLLRHARDLGPEGKSISWSSLSRLAQHGCAAPCFAARVAQAPPACQTVSRRLRPSDLLLLAEGPDARQLAWAAAAVLGVGAPPVRLDAKQLAIPEQDAVLAIWRRIYNRVPWLETGHLVQVLRLLGGERLVEKLTAHDDRQHWPAASMSAHSARCAELVRLAQVLQQQPEQVQAFIRLKSLDRRSGYLAPFGTGVSWRLLNCLALDPQLLTDWYSFVNMGGAEPQPQAAAGDEEGT
ncbi:MAG: hypothetical protein OXC07_02900 [Kistimonas sp.]|nr:hypothetical protein [Kistimonas sp.]